MTKTFEAIYENGTLKPLKKLKLPPNIKLKVTIIPVEEDTNKNLPSKNFTKEYETYYKNLTLEEVKEDISLTTEFQFLECESDQILEELET